MKKSYHESYYYAPVWNTNELADYCGVSSRTIQLWAKKKKIPSTRVSNSYKFFNMYFEGFENVPEVSNVIYCISDSSVVKAAHNKKINKICRKKSVKTV